MGLLSPRSIVALAASTLILAEAKVPWFEPAVDWGTQTVYFESLPFNNQAILQSADRTPSDPAIKSHSHGASLLPQFSMSLKAPDLPDAAVDWGTQIAYYEPSARSHAQQSGEDLPGSAQALSLEPVGQSKYLQCLGKTCLKAVACGAACEFFLVAGHRTLQQRGEFAQVVHLLQQRARALAPRTRAADTGPRKKSSKGPTIGAVFWLACLLSVATTRRMARSARVARFRVRMAATLGSARVFQHGERKLPVHCDLVVKIEGAAVEGMEITDPAMDAETIAPESRQTTQTTTQARAVGWQSRQSTEAPTEAWAVLEEVTASGGAEGSEPAPQPELEPPQCIATPQELTLERESIGSSQGGSENSLGAPRRQCPNFFRMSTKEDCQKLFCELNIKTPRGGIPSEPSTVTLVDVGEALDNAKVFRMDSMNSVGSQSEVSHEEFCNEAALPTADHVRKLVSEPCSMILTSPRSTLCSPRGGGCLNRNDPCQRRLRHVPARASPRGSGALISPRGLQCVRQGNKGYVQQIRQRFESPRES